MKKSLTTLFLILLLTLTACSTDSQSERKVDTSKPVAEPDAIETEDTKVEENTFNVIVNNITYTAELAGNATSQAFKNLLPLTMDMIELNGNEKYFVLDTELPASEDVTGEIKAGDIMLYNGNTIVLFYENFTTDYHYNRIGKITDPAGLADNLGAGSVTVTMN